MFERWDRATATVIGPRVFTGYTNLTIVLSWTEGGATISTGAVTISDALAGELEVGFTAAQTLALQTAGQALTNPKQTGWGHIKGTDSAGKVVNLERGEFVVQWTPN